MAGTRRHAEIRRAMRELAPRAPLADFEPMLAAAAAGHLRHLPPRIAAWLGAVSHIRHSRTDYDTLLAEGYDRDSARHFVLPAINDALAEWGSARRLDPEAADDGDDEDGPAPRNS